VSALDLVPVAVRDNNRVSLIVVPLTIGLSILVACLQTAWLVKKNPAYLRLTKFYGRSS
jgi:cytochrome bd-type quinol oxidase subunit 1